MQKKLTAETLSSRGDLKLDHYLITSRLLTAYTCPEQGALAIINLNPSTQVRVRIAEIADAESIANVINSAFRPAEEWFVAGDRITMPGVHKFLESGKFLLAESELGLLGCVYVELQIDQQRSIRSYLGLLSVDPARQQLGLGSVLMQTAEDYCLEQGSKVMDIKVVNLREELFGFYRKRGYVETGTATFPPELATTHPCHFIEMSKQLQAARSKE